MTTRELIMLGLIDALREAYSDPVDEDELQTRLSSLFSYARHLREEQQVPDPMPPGWNRPAPASKRDVHRTLLDAAARVEANDSWEGFIQWVMPTDESELEGAEFGLMARYRVGNLAGQGGMRVWQP